ncbi:MAG: relaxase/mobilization nuclease domain-containing protein [Campylobacterales bacterium]|nr:relaxase/mobilization nuclease domain-containing protein [Campylobacterales bacterium]MBD3824832.1 relaxase/mobilization nuclease domain-containing protein [Campylobacterota bacterium]
MHIKFISRGTGSAKSAESYLLQEHDHKGEIRQSVEVLRGNPSMVTQLADSLDTKHRYTSGVIAWHKNDRPTPEQINEVLDEFERVAFAGLDSDQYTYYAVYHGESNGAGHIHIVSPRVELQTGKAMNIAPPGWQSTYDLIADKFNTKYEWASPKEISRRQTLTRNKMNVHADMASIEAKKMIHQAVDELVDSGVLNNRADIKQYLEGIGEITREGKDYLSVKPEGFKKAIRLKGAYYEQEFKRSSQAVRAEQEQRARTSAADREREVARIESIIERVVEERADYTRGRYDPTSHKSIKAIIGDQGQDLQRAEGGIAANRERSDQFNSSSDQTQSPLLDSTPDSGTLNHTRASDRNVGARSGNLWTHPNPHPVKRADSRSQEAEGSSRTVRSDSTDVQRRNRDQEETERVADRQRHMGGTVQGVDYDRVRKAFEERVRQERTVLLERVEEVHKLIRKELGAYTEQVSADRRRSEDHHRSAEPNLDPVRADIKRSKGELRSRAVTELDGVKRATGRIGEVRQRLGTAVKRCISKALDKVKEIAKRYTYTRSSGYSRGM